jgi:hypothetical protein
MGRLQRVALLAQRVPWNQQWRVAYSTIGAGAVHTEAGEGRHPEQGRYISPMTLEGLLGTAATWGREK